MRIKDANLQKFIISLHKAFFNPLVPFGLLLWWMAVLFGASKTPIIKRGRARILCLA